ncbi:hypothetical protein J2S59_003495 [Nocardioides massiliensis]|uniref:Uncharacterized protein n=1 Tax=Nocardioides massiliensis TaxID=1325935 RepID=A0ABT9NTF1_9ACTN|nr:hypothetical protein [Nocardioides massiliensis]
MPDQTCPGTVWPAARASLWRMDGLAASLTRGTVGAQQPVHRRHRAQVGALVQQRGPGLGPRIVAEPLRRQHAQHVSLFSFGERVRRRRACRVRPVHEGPAGRGSGCPLVGQPSHARFTPTGSARSSTAGVITVATASAWPCSRRASPRARVLSHQGQRRLRLGQLGLSLLVSYPQPLDLAIAAVPGLGAQRRRRAGIGGLAPLHDVGGAQALASRDLSPLAAVSGVVLGQDLRLVLRGERAPLSGLDRPFAVEFQ